MSAAWTQEFTGAHANRNMQMGRTDTLLRWELSVFLVNGHMQQQTLWSFPDVSALAELTTDNDIWLQCSAALTAPPRTLRAEETLKIWNISPLCLSRLPLSPRLAPLPSSACVCSPFLSSFTFVSSPLLHLSPFLLSLLLLPPLSSPCVSFLVSFCYVPPFFPISPLSSPCVSSLVSLCVLSPPFVSSYYFLSSLNFLSARPSFYLLFFSSSFFPLFSALVSFCVVSLPTFLFFCLFYLLLFCLLSSCLFFPFVSILISSCLLSPCFLSLLLSFSLLSPPSFSSVFCFLFVSSFLSLCPPLFSFCLLSCFLLCPPSSSFASSLLLSSPLSSSSPQVSEATAKQKPKTEFCFGEFIRRGETLSHAHAAGHDSVNFILSMWLNVIMWLLWKFMESMSISAVINAVSRRYFLQANDATDMSEWVAALNKASKITVSAAHTCSAPTRCWSINWFDFTEETEVQYTYVTLHAV